MIIRFSPHAQSLFRGILLTIQEELSYEDAIRWHDKLIHDISQLESFPLSCPTVPLACYHTVPTDHDRLRQLIVRPYRIVYEVIDDEVHILSIRHGRMLMTVDDTQWDGNEK